MSQKLTEKLCAAIHKQAVKDGQEDGLAGICILATSDVQHPVTLVIDFARPLKGKVQATAEEVVELLRACGYARAIVDKQIASLIEATVSQLDDKTPEEIGEVRLHLYNVAMNAKLVPVNKSEG